MGAIAVLLGAAFAALLGEPRLEALTQCAGAALAGARVEVGASKAVPRLGGVLVGERPFDPVARYCSAECQGADWRAGHKAVCRELAAERGTGIVGKIGIEV
jgi:hypothetical protein